MGCEPYSYPPRSAHLCGPPTPPLLVPHTHADAARSACGGHGSSGGARQCRLHVDTRVGAAAEPQGPEAAAECNVRAALSNSRRLAWLCAAAHGLAAAPQTCCSPTERAVGLRSPHAMVPSECGEICFTLAECCASPLLSAYRWPRRRRYVPGTLDMKPLDGELTMQMMVTPTRPTERSGG
eukprot:4352189-Prymnesium_polylepis.1